MIRWLMVAALLLGGCTETKESVERPMLEPVSYETVGPLIGTGKPILLELGSTGCSGCRDMATSLYAIKARYPKSGIYFIDIKAERYVARQYGVRMMPTQVILDGSGRVVDTHVGVSGTPELIAKLKRYGVIETTTP